MNAKSLRWFTLMVILGMLVSTQIRTMKLGVKYVGLGELNTYSKQVDSEKAEVEQLKALILEKNARIDEYSNAIAEGDSIYSVLKNDIKQTKKNAGLTSVVGPGIIVQVDDSDQELNPFIERSDLIVHDMDISNLIIELQAAGAEAISINGQRILLDKTKITCHGPVIKINNEVYATPYIIKAIGDRKHLESAINAPWSYANKLRLYGIFIEVNTSVVVEINSYIQTGDYKYLKEKEVGEG